MHGFSEGIFNHLTYVVPGRNDRYYQIPFGLHWSEVTASCFMEVGYDGTLKAGVQYSYTRRLAFDGVGGAPKTDDNIVMTQIRYYPF